MDANRDELERLRREAEELRAVALALHAKAMEVQRRAKRRRESLGRQDPVDRFRRPQQNSNG